MCYLWAFDRASVFSHDENLTPEFFRFSVQSAVDMVSRSVMSSAEAQMARFSAGGHVTPPAGRTTPENVTWDLAH